MWKCNAPQKIAAKSQNLLHDENIWLTIEKKRVKTDFSNFCLKNEAIKPCKGGYFLPKQEVTGN